MPFARTLLFRTMLFILVSTGCYAQLKVVQKVPEKTRVLFVLDGSGSMEANWGSETRMATAKNILSKLVDSLKANANLELALRVYGHRYPSRANNCQDSNLEVPFGPKNHNTIINKIREIKPRGVTPITYSLLQSANDFPPGKGYRNILILITDGIESCEADPCAASVELQKRGVFLRPFIIGLGIKGGKALDCVGTYIDAENSEAFRNILNQAIETTFAKTTVSVQLLNGSNQPVETNLNVGFVNSVTGVSVFDFVHYLDKQGKPDSVQLDPVVSYHVVVATTPAYVMERVSLENGKHNVLSIPVPQGTLIARSEGRGNLFDFLVYEKGKAELLNQQRSTEPYRYLAGDYVVETLTMPRRKFDVTIEAEKVKTITLPKPGLVNLNTTSTGYGSLFELTETGESRWVANLADNTSIHSFNLLPGTYKVSFRVKQAGGSKYTAVKTFEVISEKTLNISLF